MTRELEQTGDVPFFWKVAIYFHQDLESDFIATICSFSFCLFILFSVVIYRGGEIWMRNRNWKVFLREICVVQTGKRHELAYSDLKLKHRYPTAALPNFFLGMVKIYSVFWFQLQGKRHFWFIVFTLQKMEREKKGQKNENGNVSSSELYRIAVCVERGIKWMEPLPAIFLECSHFYTQSYDFYRLTCENHENLVHSVIHKVSTSDN